MNKRRETIIEYSILLAVFLIVFFAPNLIHWVKFNYFSSLLKIEKIADIRVDTQSQIDAFGLSDTILCTAADQLSAYLYTGEQVYQRQLYGSDTHVLSAADNVLISDYARGELALLDKQLNLITEAKDLGTIEAIKTTPGGQSVLHMKNDNQIIILDAELAEVTRFVIPRGKITQVNISDDQQYILVAVVDIDQQQLDSYVLLYDFAGQAVGTSDCEGQLVYSTYMTDNQIIVTDSTIKSFNRESQLIEEIVNAGNIDQTTTHKNYLYASFLQDDKASEQLPKLSIYSDDLTYSRQLDLLSLPEGIIVNDKFIATYSEDVIYVFDHSLQSLGNIRTKQEIRAIKWLDQSHIISYDQNSIAVYALQ